MPQRGGRSSLPAPRKASTTWSRTWPASASGARSARPVGGTRGAPRMWVTGLPDATYCPIGLGRPAPRWSLRRGAGSSPSSAGGHTCAPFAA